MKKLDGIFIPAVTPFDEKGVLRLDYLEKNYECWNRTKIRGYMTLGSNGEFRSLSDDEAYAVLKTASEVIAEEKVYIAGIGRESLYQTLTFLDRLMSADIKIDYVSVLTPHYFKGLMTEEALINYFSKIADESRYPVLLYCAPGFANTVCISPEALRTLADHPNIAGIKDTSKDMLKSYMEAVGGRDDFNVMSGSLGTIMTCMEMGGKGGIVSAANYFPNLCAELYELAVAKGTEAAREYHAELKALAMQTGARASIAGVKAMMNLMGYQGGFPRLPVLPCTGRQIEEFQQVIKEKKELLAADMLNEE